ncbi:hypothetical protein [Paenibacillus pedocola]|nr:hypothetical protein [Paenibacillus typhae]
MDQQAKKAYFDYFEYKAAGEEDGLWIGK